MEEDRKSKKLALLRQKLSKNKKQKTSSSSTLKNPSSTFNNKRNFPSELDEHQIIQELDQDDKAQPDEPFDDEFEDEVLEEEKSEHSSDFVSEDEEPTSEMQQEEQKLYIKIEKGKKKEEVSAFLGNEKKISKDQYLDYDNRAYYMLHRANSEWPCLSCDFLTGLNPNSNSYQKSDIENFSKNYNKEFPIETFAVAGSQASMPSKNRIYVMRLANLHKTHKDDDDDGYLGDIPTPESDPFNAEPVIMCRSLPIKGGVNRIRTMCGFPIVALWNESRRVQIYNVSKALTSLQETKLEPSARGSFIQEYKDFSMISQFKHEAEGFALDWSELEMGSLLSGSCNGLVRLYVPENEECARFKQIGKPWSHHDGSVEDIQWCPNDVNGFASCSTDGTVQICDKRQPDRSTAAICIRAHDVDVNVISWNSLMPNLIASGDDRGEVKVWDIRFLEDPPISTISWHEDAITSLQWDTKDEWTLAAASADNRLSVWDFSVEKDDQNEQMGGDREGVPEQMIFLHQGQDDIKELRWHPVLENTIVTTAANGFNIFQPGVNQEESEDDSEDERKLEIIPEQVPGGEEYYNSKLKGKKIGRKERREKRESGMKME